MPRALNHSMEAISPAKAKRKPAPSLRAARPEELNPDSLLRLPEVIAQTQKSRMSILRAVAAGKFPKPKKIGERAVAWRWGDILEWQDGLDEVDVHAGDIHALRDLTRAWGRSERWIRDAIHRGRLRAARLGNGWIVTDEERARFEASPDFRLPDEQVEP